MDPFLPVFVTDLNYTLIFNGLPPFRSSNGTSYPTSLRSLSDTVSLLLTLMAPSSNDGLLSDPQFAGLFQTLSVDKDASDVPSAAEIVDDYEGEQETFDLQSGTGEDDNNSSDEDADDEESLGFSGLKDVVKNASKGVTERTDGEYRRSEHTCPPFLLVSL